VLDLLVEAKTNAEIASQLGFTVDGAKWHVGELLAQTGLEDRQALARWWAEEREDRRQLAFLPGVFPGRLVAFTGVAATIVALLAVAGWVALGRGSKDEVVQVPDEAPAVDEGYVSGGPIRPFEPLFHDFLIELTVEAGSTSKSRVDLRDIKTGDLLGSVNAGYRPMVVVRQETGELLVASGVGPVDPEAGYREVVQGYALQDYSLELKRTIDVPNRVKCTTYCQPLVLSTDERYLYYASRTTAPECGAGGDAAVCDIHSIVAVDLEDEDAPLVSTELARGCGVPRLNPAGESGVIVACAGQYPVEGGWTRFIGPVGGGREIDLLSQVMHVFTTSSGEVVHVRRDGTVVVIRAGGDEQAVRALPEGLDFSPRVYSQGDNALGDDRLFILFDDSDVGPHDRKYGFVVFDLASMQIEGYGRVPGADYYLPQGESVYVLRNGRIEVLDLATGRLDVLTDAVGSDVEVLLPGR
jgi:hypothetical protein